MVIIWPDISPVLINPVWRSAGTVMKYSLEPAFFTYMLYCNAREGVTSSVAASQEKVTIPVSLL